MNLEDFKKQLMIEPGSEDGAMLAARSNSVQHLAAAKQSAAFESVLEAALKLDTAANLVDDILSALKQREPSAVRSNWRGWLAAAAMVTLALGIGSFINNGLVESMPMREALVAHMNNLYEYPKALRGTEARPESVIRAVFAEFGADLSSGFGKVTFLARCKIGGKRGIHLVVTENSGDKTTIMFLPDQELIANISFDVDQVSARIVSTPTGIVALFGHDGQDLSATTAALLQGLRGIELALLN